MKTSRKRPLKIGILLPHVEERESRQPGGVTRRWSDVLWMARRAEAIGIDSLWLVDHLLLHGEGEGEQPQGIWECWSLLAALASATERIELGTLVTCTAFRSPALLAKMADTVDEICNGRLILGLGAGWHEPEFRAFGYPFDHRVDRFAEALNVIATLLREGKADLEGRYHQIHGCELRPRGPRPQGPPIMVGSTGERMMRLMAEHADLWNGWLVFGRSRPDAIPPLRAAADAACTAAGRDPNTLGRTVALQVAFPEAGADAPDQGVEPLTGSPAELAHAFRAFAKEGVGHVQLALNPSTPAALEALAPTLDLLDRDQ